MQFILPSGIRTPAVGNVLAIVARASRGCCKRLCTKTAAERVRERGIGTGTATVGVVVTRARGGESKLFIEIAVTTFDFTGTGNNRGENRPLKL